MCFTPGVVVGLSVMTMGVAMTLERLDVIGDSSEILRFWPVALILFGASMVSQAFRRPDVAGAAPDRIRARSAARGGVFWFVVMIVAVAMLSSNARERWGDRIERRLNTSTERVDGRERLRLVALMGEDHRAAFDMPFGGAKMTTVMGSSRLDLRDAKLEPGEEAVIDVFGMMGEVRLIVPEGWIVDVRTTPVMGGVKDVREIANRRRRIAGEDEDDRASRPSAVEDPPRLVVRGFIMMGGLVISS